MSDGSCPPPDAPGLEGRFAEALRRLTAEVVASDAPEELFRGAADALEALLSMLEQAPRGVRPAARSAREGSEVTARRDGDGDRNRPLCAAASANPLSPPLTLLEEDEDTWAGRVRFSAAHEGGPGIVHGGCIAAAFGELLGRVPTHGARIGVPGSLRVRYRNPCPLETDLHMEGRVQGRQGREVSTQGTLRAGDRPLADARATFRLLDRE